MPIHITCMCTAQPATWLLGCSAHLCAHLCGGGIELQDVSLQITPPAELLVQLCFYGALKGDCFMQQAIDVIEVGQAAQLIADAAPVWAVPSCHADRPNWHLERI